MVVPSSKGQPGVSPSEDLSPKRMSELSSLTLRAPQYENAPPSRYLSDDGSAIISCPAKVSQL